MKVLKTIFFIVFLFFLFSSIKADSMEEKSWPKRVLITNDNGIEDIKIIELARAFSKVAETYVVASLTDQSGTSNYHRLGSRRPFVEVEKRDLGPNIIAYGLDGYPADCVIFAGLGLLKDNPLDVYKVLARTTDTSNRRSYGTAYAVYAHGSESGANLLYR